MNAHPGGEGHTRHMLEIATLPKGSHILDMGAGAGETVTLMQTLGYNAEGIDRVPRAEFIRQGDLLRTGFEKESFDAVLSQCAFFVSGNVPQALREAYRLLKNNGLLLLSDVFFEDPVPQLKNAGFILLYQEDLTEQWQEYYLEALWKEDALSCCIPKGKCSYWFLIGRKC